MLQDEPECHNKTVAVVTEVPEESCDIIPSKICRTANKLVPHLEPVEKCDDSPREVCSFGLKPPTVLEKPLVTKWCYNDTGDQPFIFGEKLIKKDRKPKSNKFKHKNIPSAVGISKDHVIHNEVIDDVAEDEDVNDSKKPKKPSIFGNKLIPQNLLPPKPANDPNRPSRKIIQNDGQNDENEFSFIETFLKTAKQDPEEPKAKIDVTADNELLDAGLISDVFAFNGDDIGDNNINGNIGVEKIKISTLQKPDLGPLAKVVRHDSDSPVSKTIIIQNNPEAHRAFGVKNPPKKFSSELRTHLRQKTRDSKAANDVQAGPKKPKTIIGSVGTANFISQDQLNDQNDFLSPPASDDSLFGFGISEITDEEKEQYR